MTGLDRASLVICAALWAWVAVYARTDSTWWALATLTLILLGSCLAVRAWDRWLTRRTYRGPRVVLRRVDEYRLERDRAGRLPSGRKP